MMADLSPNTTNNKQLNMFMLLTKSLLSNDETKRSKRINLSSKITSTIMNNKKFSSYLLIPSNLSINEQLNSIQYQISQRCIELLKHRDNEIHIFAKTLFYKLTDNNDTLTNIILALIFNAYTTIMPKSLIILTNNHTQDEIYSQMDILGKLRAITVIIDRIQYLFNRKNSLQTRYNTKIFELQTSFNTLVSFSLSAQPSTNTNIDLTKSRFSFDPYRLPSLDIQIILIEFWNKYPLNVPNDTYFRTLYLLRWLCVMPIDFETNHKLYKNGRDIINHLLNIICLNFNDNFYLNKDENTSETVLTLYSLIGFLGGSPISICDNINKTNVSMITYRLMERIPVVLRDNLSKNLNEIIKNLGFQKLEIIISNMFEWPQTDRIYEWILQILKQIEKNGMWVLLTNLCITYGNRIAKQLKNMNDKNNLNGALILTKYLLYGLRSTAQGFHNMLSSLCDAITTLKLLDNDTFFYGKLHDIIELCRVMLFIWPGYPSLYYNISQILHSNNCQDVSEQRIRNILNKFQWKANRPKMDDSKIKNSPNYNYGFGTGYNKNNSRYSSAYLSSSIRLAPLKRHKLTDKAGLTNLGATCYMNSIVQALFVSDDFRKKLLTLKALDYGNKQSGDKDNKDKNKNNVLNLNESKWKKMKDVTFELQNIFGHLKFTKRESVSTRTFVNLLPAPWTAGRQQDASEFAKYLLDCIWETIQHSNSNEKYIKNIKKDINCKIDPFFGGLQRNNIKCNKCNNISAKLESFTEIPLSMSQNNAKEESKEELCTLKLLDEHFGIEILKGDNKYFCSKCNEKVEAQRYTEVVKPPNHLIICFKRFSWNYENMKRIKKNDWVNCPLTLDLPVADCMDKKMNDKSESDMDIDYESDKDLNNKNSVKYLLYSAVIHSGKSAEFGHYYTIGRHSRKSIRLYHGENNENDNDNDGNKNDKNKDIWYMFNDRNISISDYDKLCKVSRYYTTDVPYMLFYKRIDEKKMINKNMNNDKEMKDENENKENNENDSEWEKKVDEDNKTFEKELIQFASKKSP